MTTSIESSLLGSLKGWGRKVFFVLIALYLLQLTFCLYREWMPSYSAKYDKYSMAVYREQSLCTYFPYLGLVWLMIPSHQIVVIEQEMQTGASWRLRIDTCEAVLDWAETYMQVTNPGTLEQGIRVMAKGCQKPDYPIISASDYLFHNL